MRKWPVHTARARFSELLRACLREGPQVITRRGVEAAVLIPLEQWQSVPPDKKSTLKDLLLTDMARANLSTPPRGHRRSRTPRFFV